MGRIVEALGRARGAYSLLFLTLDRMIAARDPYGFRPLVLGKFKDEKNDGAYVVASETCALDLIEADYVRDVEPGEILTFGPDGMESLKPFPPVPHAKCIFEYIYFARPDSNIYGHNVYQVRKALGRQLARESFVEAELVTPVPDSGVPAAIGFAEESKIPLEFGLIRNHYVGRTFIEPAQSIRHFGVKIKLNAQKEVLQGKRVIVVDDSIVRGTTSRKIIRMLRDAGAREVHMRISSPATTGPCYYGIDTPTRGELIASSSSLEEIRRYIEADTLAYLSQEGMYSYFKGEKKGFCDACFSGNYPVHFEDEGMTRQLHLFDALSKNGA
jgi:amidophosphoribosyltransferase